MVRTRQMSMLLTLVISAVLLAIASFVAILMVSSRSEGTQAADGATSTSPPIESAPAGQKIVEGMNVVLNPDPSKAVYTLSEGPPIAGIAPLQPAPTVDPFLQQFPSPTPPLPGDPLAVPTATPPLVIEQPIATVPPPVTVAPTRDPNPVIFIQYTVQNGDSLYGIAAAQNSSIELMSLHNIADDHLVPGTVLNLPVANPAYCPGHRAYVVRDIDTLFRIATIFSTTVEQLRAMNGITDDNVIQVTQVICVP